MLGKVLHQQADTTLLLDDDLRVALLREAHEIVVAERKAAKDSTRRPRAAKVRRR